MINCRAHGRAVRLCMIMSLGALVAFCCLAEAASALVIILSDDLKLTFPPTRLIACLNESHQTGPVVSRDHVAAHIFFALPGGGTMAPMHPTRASFSDVTKDCGASEYAEYASGEGVVRGDPDGECEPRFPLDRGQMAVLIARAVVTLIGMKQYIPLATPSFPDALTMLRAHRCGAFAPPDRGGIALAAIPITCIIRNTPASEIRRQYT